jgi:LysR family glycine cleavage system transcriptional activator
MAVEAAIEGQGVALVNSALVAGDLAARRLVKAFELTMPVSFSYYVVCPDFAAERPKVAAFRSWILDQARHRDDDPILDG